jgi:hypothetical protein
MDGGVMAAVARAGAARRAVAASGCCATSTAAAPRPTYSLCTGRATRATLAVAASGDVVIAVGGEWYALGSPWRRGHQVVLAGWEVRRQAAGGRRRVASPKKPWSWPSLLA